MATIHDVAKAAGVSIATVSRALNNRGHVDSKTRAKVQAAAERLGYVSRKAALPAASHLGRGLVALFAPTDAEQLEREAIYQRGFSHLSQTAAKLGCRLVFHREAELSVLSPGDLRKEYDGALFFSPRAIHEGRLISLGRAGLPYIVANRRYRNPEIPWVTIDEEAGCRLIIDRLWNLGRRRFAYVGFNEDAAEGSSQWQRFRSAEQALKEKDSAQALPFLPESIFTLEDPVSAIVAFVKEENPDALIVFNDYYGLYVLHALETLGVKVGEDLSLVAFDNTYLAELGRPRISCVHIPLDAVCSLALLHLHAYASIGGENGERPTVQTLVLPWFVARDSCGTAGMTADNASENT